MADDELADGMYTEAIERLERPRVVVHLAGAHLRFGEWFRRVDRRVDGRRHLNEAHEMFTRMGAQAFAERARRELVATGEKVSRQPVGSGAELTAQEAQITRLAGDGLTNQEIGAGDLSVECLLGLFVPVIGVMAAIGLVLYFIGAVVTVVRPRVYSRSAVLLLL